jgi:hypothetical protein
VHKNFVVIAIDLCRMLHYNCVIEELIYLKTWPKATFIIVLLVFIVASVTISFISMARAPFEYEYRTDIVGTLGNEGWVLFGFNGNNNTKKV